MRLYNIHLMTVTIGDEKEDVSKAIFKGRVSEISPELMKNIKSTDLRGSINSKQYIFYNQI